MDQFNLYNGWLLSDYAFQAWWLGFIVILWVKNSLLPSFKAADREYEEFMQTLTEKQYELYLIHMYREPALAAFYETVERNCKEGMCNQYVRQYLREYFKYQY
jgi:hypothetical protein